MSFESRGSGTHGSWSHVVVTEPGEKRKEVAWRQAGGQNQIRLSISFHHQMGKAAAVCVAVGSPNVNMRCEVYMTSSA